MDKAREDLEVVATRGSQDPKYRGKTASQVRAEAWTTIKEKERRKRELDEELKELNSWRYVGDYLDGNGKLFDKLRRL